MSNATSPPPPPGAGPADVAGRRYDEVLGYLLKHAHVLLQERSDDALAPLGVTSRDLGVLRVIATGAARSQQDLATVLGIDRTSMVALIDSLGARGLLERRPSDLDRRRNVVLLTDRGLDTYRRAETLSIAVDDDFLRALTDRESTALRRTLQRVLEARAPMA